MNLHQTIKEQIKEALRAKDGLRLDTLRGLNALFMNEILTQKGLKLEGEFLPDERALALIKRSVKQRLDSIKQFEIGKRPDLADKEKKEMAILESYLPKALSRDEIKVAATKVIDGLKKQGQFDPKAAGRLTGLVMKELGGRGDGNEVKAVVEDLIK
ncbi:MAG: GatB/YqeY domain-containing protein [Candidatus Paceibacterota bacterium]